MLQGIDISNNNGTVNWPAVAATGYAFAIVKATEGTTFLDAFLAANWQGMRAVGMLRGAYHFAQPSENDPVSEARWFISQMAGVKLLPGDILALDLEAGAGDLSGWAATWLATVEQALGFRPLLYTSPSFIQEHGLGGNATLGQYGLWLASWGSMVPNAPAGWEFWAVWQHSATATVPGVSGACDVNYFNGDASQFARYGAQAPWPAKLAFDDSARFKTIEFVAGGSGVADLTNWLAQYADTN